MGATRKDSSNLLEKMGYDPKGVKSFKVTKGGKVTVRYYLDPDNKDAGYKEDTFRLPKPLPLLKSSGSTVYTTAEVKALPVGSVLEHGWFPGNVERGWEKVAENQWATGISLRYGDSEMAETMGRKVLRVGPAVKPGPKVGDKVYDTENLPVGTTLWPDFKPSGGRWWLVKGADGKLRDSNDEGFYNTYNSTGRIIRSLPPKVGDAITTAEQAKDLPVGSSVWFDGYTGDSGWWRKTEPDRWVAYSRDGSLSGVLRNHTDASLIAAREGLTPRRLRSLGA